ncbi:hypothetical protein VaNZ11_004814, partial [Volvox africanus]
MRYCCAGKTEDHSYLLDPLEVVDADEPCCPQPASTSITWAVRRPQHGHNIFHVSLESHTRRDWAVRKPQAIGPPRSPAPTRGAPIHHGWAYRSNVELQQNLEGGALSHTIVLYHNPLSDWASGTACSRLRGRGASPNAQVDLGFLQGVDESAGGSAQAAASRQKGGYGRASRKTLQQQQKLPQPAGQQQGQQQQGQPQQTPMRSRPPNRQALPYSVPTLAVGDVFLSCNTVAGLEHADDWDVGCAASSGSRSVATRSSDAGSAGSEAEAGLGAGRVGVAAPIPASPVAHLTQPKPPAAAAAATSTVVATAAAAAHRRAPLDPASELLLRMSSIVGGQRLIFVSKESAELVRRALLLSRYDAIMAERRAAAVEVSWEEEEDEATAEGTRPVSPKSPIAATSTATVATSAVATKTRAGPWLSGTVFGSGARGGWGSGGSSGGEEGDAHSPSFRPWLRNRSKGREDPVPIRTSSPASIPSSTPQPVNDTHKSIAGSASSQNHANGGNVALLESSKNNHNHMDSGSGGGSSNSDKGSSPTGINGDGGGSAQDGMQPELPSWVPGLMRDAAAAAARSVSGWLMHSIGGGTAGSSSSSSMGNVQQGVIALFRGRGVSGDVSGSGGVVDVSAGPRPRLPAPPLTGVMPLPLLKSAAAAMTATENGGEERHLQQLGGDGGVIAAAVGTAGSSQTADVRHGSASEKAVADRRNWDSNTLIRELKQLEEEKVITDAEALLKAGKRGAAGGGGGDDGFLPPFSFSSYVARLPLEAAFKAILSTTEAAALAEAASGDTAAAPVRRRFLLVPDSVDEQAVEGSREIDRLVAELEAAAEAAEAAEAEAAGEVAPGTSSGAAAGGTAIGTTGGHGLRVAPRPRVALNLYDSDASHWVLDVVDELEQEASEAASKGNSSSCSVGGSVSSSSNSQQLPLPPERFIRGTPSGPSDDLGGLVQLPGPLEPASPTSYDTRTQAVAGPRTAAASTATITSSSSSSGGNSCSCSDGSSTNSGGGGGGSRTPVFSLPGVTVSVRAADGTLLRLRPAFMSLQQLAAALAMARDAVAASWRRQRSAARWRVVSALDVLTVHSAGFPVVRFPPPSSTTGGGAGGGGGGGGGDEDSDDGIPEAKELLREMGAGNRRPSAVDAAASAGNSPEAAPRGVLGVLSTLAVGVVSFSAWCLVSAVDVWEDIYSRTPWGLEEIGVPQHVNVTPTYLEEHVQHLAEVNAPAVAAAANAVYSRAVQRTLEKRARRRLRNTQAPDQQEQQQQQQLGHGPPVASPSPSDTKRLRELLTADEVRPGGVKTAAADAGHGSSGGSGTGVHRPIGIFPAPSEGRSEAADTSVRTSVSERRGAPLPAGADASLVTTADRADIAAANKGHRSGQRQRDSDAAAATAAAFNGLSLQTETMAGLTVLLQLTWAAARAAHTRALREADGILGSNTTAGGGGIDGLLRLAGGRGSRDGGFTGGGGGGGGLTLTASQDGELGLVAKLDIRPIASAALPAAAAAGSIAADGAASSTAAAASGQGAPAGTDTPGEVTSPPSAPSPSSAQSPPSTSSVKPEGLSVRKLSPGGHSGVRYELMHSSAKLVSQMTRPHKFEVGFHLNMRKLLGDLSEDAPDQLLKLQQPAGPTPPGSGSGSAVTAATAATAAGRQASGPVQAAPAPEAYGLLLIG